MRIKQVIPAALALALLGACSQAPTSPPTAEVPEPEPPQPCPVVETPVCPEPKVVEKVVIKEVPAELPPMATTAGKMHLPILGGVEWVTVEPPGFRMEARLDTGAETSSIHAEDVQLVEKDGEQHVRFTLVDPQKEVAETLELPLSRKVLIRQAEGEPDKRYVVKLWLALGETRSRIEVTLSDRDSFDHQLLIGRNFLTDTAIVDVSRQYTTGADNKLSAAE